MADNQIEEIYPRMSLAITIFELQEISPGIRKWIATIKHTFYGDDIQRIQEIMKSHSQTDAFFRGSFEGKWDGVILKNSKPEIEET